MGQEKLNIVSRTAATMRATKKWTSNTPTVETGSSSNTLESGMVVELSMEAGDILGIPMRQIMKVQQTGLCKIVQLRPYHHLNRAELVLFSPGVCLSVRASVRLYVTLSS